MQVESESDEGISYVWLLDGTEIAQTKSLEYMFEEVGEYELTLRVSQGESRFDYPFTVTVTFENIEPAPEGATAYVTKFLILFRLSDNLLIHCRYIKKVIHRRL